MQILLADLPSELGSTRRANTPTSGWSGWLHSFLSLLLSFRPRLGPRMASRCHSLASGASKARQVTACDSQDCRNVLTPHRVPWRARCAATVNGGFSITWFNLSGLWMAPGSLQCCVCVGLLGARGCNMQYCSTRNCVHGCSRLASCACKGGPTLNHGADDLGEQLCETFAGLHETFKL